MRVHYNKTRGGKVRIAQPYRQYPDIANQRDCAARMRFTDFDAHPAAGRTEGQRRLER